MLYIPLLIYSLHACLICIVYVEIVPKTSLKPKRLKNCNFSTKCLITPPPLDTPTSRSYSIQTDMRTGGTCALVSSGPPIGDITHILFPLPSLHPLLPAP